MRINAKRLYVLMAERELTRTALQQLSGVSRQGIWSALAKGSCSEPRTVGKLAKALNVPVEELIEE